LEKKTVFQAELKIRAPQTRTETITAKKISQLKKHCSSASHSTWDHTVQIKVH